MFFGLFKGIGDFDEIWLLKLYEVGLLRIRINEMVSEDAAKKLGKSLNHYLR